jgi:hypothetical protein
MYRFLSEIDKITGERGINRKELAEDYLCYGTWYEHSRRNNSR